MWLCPTSLRYTIDEMSWELNSCVYQSADDKMALVIPRTLRADDGTSPLSPHERSAVFTSSQAVGAQLTSLTSSPLLDHGGLQSSWLPFCTVSCPSRQDGKFTHTPLSLVITHESLHMLRIIFKKLKNSVFCLM